MAKQKCCIYFCIFLSFTISSGGGADEIGRSNGTVKLFVFGDSYADTGNDEKFFSISWMEPYGITFPGTPDGRFSDGRVLTDYIASFLGIPSPLPYNGRTSDDESSLAYGMNFAFGGTGVFNTLVIEPNMTTQIDFFQQLLEQNVYTKQDLDSSVALVSLAGNDYFTFMAFNGGNLQGFPAFTETVINQLGLNLMRIHGLGVKKIAVTALQPLGCLPSATILTSYQYCNEFANSAAIFHNNMLQQTVQKLNNEGGDAVFVIVDLYSAFLSALNIQQNYPGTSEFENPLRPCCVGVGGLSACGSVDLTGAKQYIVCEEPQLSFFWDMVHPSNQGWLAVYSVLKSSLHQLY